jgi:hypothetical protein
MRRPFAVRTAARRVAAVIAQQACARSSRVVPWASGMLCMAYMWTKHVTGAAEAAGASPRPLTRIAPPSDLPDGV